jgi:hypothetical protein
VDLKRRWRWQHKFVLTMPKLGISFEPITSKTFRTKIR